MKLSAEKVEKDIYDTTMTFYSLSMSFVDSQLPNLQTYIILCINMQNYNYNDDYF